MTKPRIAQTIIVEGKYDKTKLSSIVDAHIITTEGFGIFSNTEKQALIRRIALERGILIITDSDASGFKIRAFLKGLVPPESISQVILPAVKGKERRKDKPSAQGLLGLEGLPADAIRSALKAFSAEDGTAQKSPSQRVEKRDFYLDGLSGTDGSVERRRALARELGLPEEMSSTALLGAVNLLMDVVEYRAVLERMKNDE